MNRNTFIKSLLTGIGAIQTLPTFAGHTATTHTLPILSYPTDALEPHIDKLTMEIHHGKHHKAYVDNLNKAIVGTPSENLDIDALVKSIDDKTIPAIRNNGGGHWNHSFFWNIMAPNKGGIPTGKSAEVITAQFGSIDKFKEEFAKAATSRFGSGWAWLIITEDNKLQIVSTPNQDNPLMALAVQKGKPILALDVWEHAYYLKYQNKRADYIAAFWNLVNWDKVNELLG